MGGGVGGYAAVCARVRVKYSNLLGPAEMRQLSDAPDLSGFNEALKKTRYQALARGIEAEVPPIADLADSFRRGLGDEAASVIRAMPGAARRVVARLHRRHEVNNIKATLRGIAAARPEGDQSTTWARIQPLLFPLGDFSSLPFERMTEAGGIPAAVELLRGTPYHEALAFALRRYSAEQSLFPLEVALDLAYWRGLWQEARKLQGEDHRQATRVIGTLIDANNLMWAIRYKVYKQLSEEELINYTLSIGYRVRDSDIRAIAAGAEIAAVVGRLYPELQNTVRMHDDELKSDLPQLETQLKRAMAQRCMAAFLGNPFHVGLPLAYMVLHDLEVQDLTTILEAKATTATTEEYQPFLIGIPLAA
jgi:V/A-type H+/Na+-transporting ATPase subunit C